MKYFEDILSDQLRAMIKAECRVLDLEQIFADLEASYMRERSWGCTNLANVLGTAEFDFSKKSFDDFQQLARSTWQQITFEERKARFFLEFIQKVLPDIPAEKAQEYEDLAF